MAKIFDNKEKTAKELRAALEGIGVKFTDEASVNNFIGRDNALKQTKVESWVDSNRVKVYVGLASPHKALFDAYAKNGLCNAVTGNCVKSKEVAYIFGGDNAETIIANVKAVYGDIVKTYAKQETKKPESKKASRAKKQEKTA